MANKCNKRATIFRNTGYLSITSENWPGWYKSTVLDIDVVISFNCLLFRVLFYCTESVKIKVCLYLNYSDIFRIQRRTIKRNLWNRMTQFVTKWNKLLLVIIINKFFKLGNGQIRNSFGTCFMFTLTVFTDLSILLLIHMTYRV